METANDGNSQKTAEPQAPSNEETLPQGAPSSQEEPILLNKLFQETGRDIDALFPDPTLKKLLSDVVRTRRKNDRFLKALVQNHLSPEPDPEEEP